MRDALNVLVPVDLSRASMRVMPVAMRVGDVRVLTVAPHSEFQTMPTPDQSDSASTLQARLTDAGFDKVPGEVTIGSSAERIVHWVDGNRPDLVVMSSHGRTGLGKLLLGSVAERVMRLCPRPLWILRADTAIERLAQAKAPRLLVAVDLSESGADDVVQAAVPWARVLGATVDVAYVLPERDILDDPLFGRKRAALQALLQGLPKTMRGQAKVLFGEARTALAEAAVSADLLVVGSHGRSALGRLLMGSTSEGLARLVPAIAIVPVCESVQSMGAPAPSGRPLCNTGGPRT